MDLSIEIEPHFNLKLITMSYCCVSPFKFIQWVPGVLQPTNLGLIRKSRTELSSTFLSCMCDCVTVCNPPLVVGCQVSEKHIRKLSRVSLKSVSYFSTGRLKRFSNCFVVFFAKNQFFILESFFSVQQNQSKTSKKKNNNKEVIIFKSTG